MSAGIAAAVRGAGVHAVMGIGGAPEGVITAAAMRCLHGEMLGRLVVDGKEMERRMEKMGIRDPRKIYRAEDLAPGKKIIFAACGVTPGNLLQGVRFFGDGYRTHSLVMTSQPNTVSFRDTVHLNGQTGSPRRSPVLNPDPASSHLHGQDFSACVCQGARDARLCSPFHKKKDTATATGPADFRSERSGAAGE